MSQLVIYPGLRGQAVVTVQARATGRTGAVVVREVRR
jgi:hypothetical protein